MIDNEKDYQELVEQYPIGESEALFQVIADQKIAGIFIIRNRRILFINNYLASVLGYDAEVLMNSDWEVLLNEIFEEDKEKIVKNFNDLGHGENGILNNFRYRIKNKKGEIKWIDLWSKIVKFKGRNSVFSIAIDVTERIEAEERANYYEFHDSLTDLPNREMLFRRIDSEIKKVKPSRRKSEKNDYIFALMCLGPDKFKNINDMYGTLIGDILLKKIGLKLKKSFRENDFVSRYIGDSFMILFSGIGKYEDVIGIIQKTHDVFSDPFIIEDNVFRISCSIGVCLYPHDGLNKEQLTKNSESAMYMAKEQGCNSHRLYNAEMNTQILTRLKIERELEHAIFHNHFVAYYQPKYDRNYRIVGIESLIRWHSAEKDKIFYPSYFIPVAEKNGMIIEIGNIILYKSCAEAKKWMEKGYPPLMMAVNISPSQFKQQRLIQDIKDVINKTGLDPRFLELEITESGIMENEKLNINILNEIHNLGVKIAIDDFGTGYSSLSKLKDYPIDSLKIDKSFIENLPGNEKSSTITTTIIDLAHNLGFKVVAEGVETKEQLDFLNEHGCDEFQGYYFSIPLSHNEFEEKLKQTGGNKETV